MNLDAPVQRRGDAIEHRQRVAFIIGVFEAANDRRSGANHPCQLPLAKTGLGPQGDDFTRNLISGPCPLQFGKPSRLTFVIAAMKDF